MKICRLCNRKRHERFFRAARKHKDGLASECNDCHIKYERNRWHALTDEDKESILNQRKNYARKYYLKNKDKILARNRANWPDYYRKNRNKILTRSKTRKKEYKKLWIQLLEKRFGPLRCSRCGYREYFSALDFHHTNPLKKERGVAQLLGWKPTKANLEKIDDGVVILCSNCHRGLHWEEELQKNARSLSVQK